MTENKTFQTAEEINKYLNSLNIFQYAAVEEKHFEDTLAGFGDYERLTTFYSDLSIAERYGENAIKDTYRNVIKSWMNDIQFITEFALCLNYKSWEWDSRENDSLVSLYADLFYEAQDKIYDHYKDNEEALSYYYRITD